MPPEVLSAWLAGIPARSIRNRPVKAEEVYFNAKLPTAIGGAVLVSDYLYGSGGVTIGKGLASIGIEGFVGCSNLSAIQVDSQNPTFRSMDGVL